MVSKASLTELSASAHANWKYDPNHALKIASEQHLISVKVNEVGHAASQFPIILSKAPDGESWMLAVLTSFELNQNLFVENGQWKSSYLPLGVQTYPFFLMRKEGDGKEFCVGIQEDNPVFSQTEGEPLFEENGTATQRLSAATSQLQQDLNNEAHTYQFTKLMDEFGLIKSLDLLVHYKEEKINTLKGLHTIDEQALQELEDEKLLEIRKRGYLMPSYALMGSLFQINALLDRHNARHSESNAVSHVQLKEPEQAEAVQ